MINILLLLFTITVILSNTDLFPVVLYFKTLKSKISKTNRQKSWKQSLNPNKKPTDYFSVFCFSTLNHKHHRQEQDRTMEKCNLK